MAALNVNEMRRLKKQHPSGLPMPTIGDRSRDGAS